MSFKLPVCSSSKFFSWIKTQVVPCNSFPTKYLNISKFHYLIIKEPLHQSFVFIEYGTEFNFICYDVLGHSKNSYRNCVGENDKKTKEKKLKPAKISKG